MGEATIMNDCGDHIIVRNKSCHVYVKRCIFFLSLKISHEDTFLYPAVLCLRILSEFWCRTTLIKIVQRGTRCINFPETTRPFKATIY